MRHKGSSSKKGQSFGPVEEEDLREDISHSESARGLLTDALKKVLTAGVGAAFMTEDTIRNYLSEIKLPKDILNLLIQGANKSKDEITHRVSREVIQLLQKIDFAKEVSKFAESHKFKISAEIEIIKKDKK